MTEPQVRSMISSSNCLVRSPAWEQYLSFQAPLSTSTSESAEGGMREGMREGEEVKGEGRRVRDKSDEGGRQAGSWKGGGSEG